MRAKLIVSAVAIALVLGACSTKTDTAVKGGAETGAPDAGATVEVEGGAAAGTGY